MQNVIMRVVYNRPEMLKLTIDAELKARSVDPNYFSDDYKTLFVVEHGATDKVKELVKEYPFDKEIIFRQEKFGLSKNILEGFKVAFGRSSDYVIYLEDDMLIHESYFKYMNALLSIVDSKDFSVLSAYSFNDNGDPEIINKGHHYAAWAPLINKEFFVKYILPCSTDVFYKNPVLFVQFLNERYKKHWESRRYKYRNITHHQQAGLINRLVDAAMIDKGMHVFMPQVARVQHIGFYGDNRAKKKEIPGKTFEERVNSLKEIISDDKKMYDYTGSKQYNDYRILSPKLDTWSGKLTIV